MKRTLIVALIAVCSSLALAQDEQIAFSHMSDTSSRSGDQFSLEGALHLFHLAKSPQNFEELINQEENHVSNLDFNDDGMIDYLRIEDNLMGDDHVFVIQAVFGENQFQDIATIELSRKSKDSVIVQIVGDSELYRGSVILEPAREVESNFNGPKGPSLESFRIFHLRMNVWLWPCVTFVYSPSYFIWKSPYYWQNYPRFWKPGKRFFWKQHRWYCDHFHHYNVLCKRALRIEAPVAHYQYYHGSRKSFHAHSNQRYWKKNNTHPKAKYSPADKMKSHQQGQSKGQKGHRAKGKG